MRLVKPKAIPNVEDERLLDSVRQCNDLLADDDLGRGPAVRVSARRALYLFALRDRGHDTDTGTAKRSACAHLWGVDPDTFSQVGAAK